MEWVSIELSCYEPTKKLHSYASILFTLADNGRVYHDLKVMTYDI